MINIEENQVVLVDKPYEWTSFGVVKRIRGTYGLKKVGHAGTLDPLATGLLIICTGKKTKEIESFMDLEKEYTGVFEIGKTTPSVDLETDFDSNTDWSHITPEECLETTKTFIGEIAQVPPIYSAVKINGKRAYQHAREGRTAELKSRTVTVSQFELTSIDLPEITFKIRCSKGTYIRSLVRDFGELIKTGACLKELRRTKIGDFDVANALTIDQIKR